MAGKYASVFATALPMLETAGPVLSKGKAWSPAASPRPTPDLLSHLSMASGGLSKHVHRNSGFGPESPWMGFSPSFALSERGVRAVLHFSSGLAYGLDRVVHLSDTFY